MYKDLKQYKNGYPNMPRLVDAICEVRDDTDLLPDWDMEGKVAVTYCNQAIDFIAKKMGYEGFRGKLANEIINIMEASSDWLQPVHVEVQNLCNKGYLVIAGLEAEPNGHVVVLRPGEEIQSGKWHRAVPRCINVGQDVFIGLCNNYPAGINWSFVEKPKFYLWKGM